MLFLSALQIKAQYSFDNVLYGAAYYHEYMPYERLDEDIRLMKRAGLTVVRVGESAWGVFEPQEGNFEFEWMDRILDKMHAAGIKVILGTPTYSIPAWLAYKHPEVLAEHAKGNKAYYGIRQNMDFTNPTYQFYCERIIRKMLERYAQHPAVIGYQVDNETEARGVNNRDYFFGFRNYIKQKFNNDLNLLAKEWGMNYWGMNINTWEEFYPRDGVTSPSYKNEWERYNRKEVADFLNWQCDLVNEYKRKDQFVTHCFMPDFHNIDQVESFRQMQYPAINVYHDVQDKQDGQRIAYAGDFVRTVADNNYIVMETNAQGIGWDARTQFPPYDNQLRQNVYAHYASGANMVEYWHWHSIHNSFETYWKGLLSHDFKENDTYRSAKVIGKEFAELGNHLVNLKKTQAVAKENSDKMRQMYNKLANDIQMLETKRNGIKATVAAAKTQEKMNKISSGSKRSMASLETFDRMEDKANRMLDSAMAEAELSADMDAGNDLVNKYVSGESSSTVDDELAAMKQNLVFCNLRTCRNTPAGFLSKTADDSPYYRCREDSIGLFLPISEQRNI